MLPSMALMTAEIIVFCHSLEQVLCHRCAYLRGEFAPRGSLRVGNELVEIVTVTVTCVAFSGAAAATIYSGNEADGAERPDEACAAFAGVAWIAIGARMPRLRATNTSNMVSRTETYRWPLSSIWSFLCNYGGCAGVGYGVGAGASIIGASRNSSSRCGPGIFVGYAKGRSWIVVLSEQTSKIFVTPRPS